MSKRRILRKSLCIVKEEQQTKSKE
jgi:hypothetical protein